MTNPTDDHRAGVEDALKRFWEDTAKKQEAERKRQSGETKPRTQEHATLKRSIVDAINASGLAWASTNEVGTFRYRHSDALITVGLGTGSLDIIGYWFGSGRMFWIEIKVGKDKLRHSQERFIKKHSGRGPALFVVRSVDEALAAVEDGRK